MNIIAVNGRSAAAKTTLMHGIAEHVKRIGNAERRPFIVERADAGRFFRAATHEGLVELNAQDKETPPPIDEVHAAVAEALRKGTPYEVGRDRGNLGRPIIEMLVSEISKPLHVQEAGVTWYSRTVANSYEANADVLVINGRNPVDRMRETIETYRPDEIAVSLELLAVCGIRTAAERVLAASNILRPDPSDIEHSKEYEKRLAIAEAGLDGRRRDDDSRHNYPYHDPAVRIQYDSSMRADEVIAMTRGDLGPIYIDGGVNPRFPLPVELNTGLLDRETMIHQARHLAAEAIHLSVFARV